MKRRHIYSICWGLLALFFASSCSDNVDYVVPFPDMEINIPGLETTYFYGEPLDLMPSVQYGESELNDFSVNWYLEQNNNRVLISDQPRLSYVFNTLGDFTIYCEVTNNETTVVTSIAENISVRNHSYRGWYVLKETEDGNTDMDGFFSGSDTPVYNIAELNLGHALAGTPKALIVSPRYMVPDTVISYAWGGTDPVRTEAVIPFSEHDGFVFDPNSSTTLATKADLFRLTPESANGTVVGASFSSTRITLAMDNGAYSMLNGNSFFFPAMDGDYRLDGHFTVGSSGNSLAFDEKYNRFVLIGGGYTTTDQISYFTDAYHAVLNNGLEVPVNNMTGNLVFLENANLNYAYSANYVYALMREPGENNSIRLLGMDYAGLIRSRNYTYDFYPGDYSPVTMDRTLNAAEMPMLVGADLFTMNKTVPVMYFANNGRVGSYNIQSGAYNESFITDIPAGEEITFMKYLVGEYSDDWGVPPGFEGLMVATYNASTGSYHIYRYWLEGLTTASRDEKVMSGTGKVSKVVYVHGGGNYTWSGDLYLYYN